MDQIFFVNTRHTVSEAFTLFNNLAFAANAFEFVHDHTASSNSRKLAELTTQL